MFEAEVKALGDVWEAILSQGSLFLNTHVADLNEPKTKWYMFVFAAVIVYGLADMLIKRRK